MNRPLKIALVSAFDYAFDGGVTDHVKSLADQFEHRGHTVKVIAPWSGSQRVDNPNFVPMGRPVPVPSGGSIARVSLSVWLRPRIKNLLQSESFDIIHLHEPFSGFVPLHVLSVSNAPNVGTFHTFKGSPLYGIGVKRLLMPYYRKLHGRIAVSEPAQSYISQYFQGPFEIIPNGIRVDDFALSKPFPHLTDGMLNLLFLGRLEKRKGLKHLLAAFSKLKWDWPNLRLVVVGPGKPDADSYRIISERNIQDVVLVGSVSDEEKARYYKTADIYCSPATGKESFGIVLLEAMAAGTPIVASAIEGYSSVITHGQDGLLVPPKDDNELAAAINTLLRDPALRERLATAGRETAEEYRWEQVAGKVMNHYMAVLHRQAALAK